MSSSANDFSDDARRVKNQAEASASRIGDEAKASASRMGDDAKVVAGDAKDELAKLRAQVERLMQERVTPALAGAADQVQDYANRARESIEDQADALSDTVRERPLAALGIAAAAGYLIGRLMGGNTYVYPRDRH